MTIAPSVARGRTTAVTRPGGHDVLRHDVLAELRDRILTGDLAAGERIREMPLATAMGTSRGPIREALRQLEQEGLVATLPHRGATVVGVPDDEVETIYALRAGLEARAFRHACTRIGEADLAALDALVGAMVAASRAGDLATVTELDLRFHGRVIELAGFQYLRRLWTSVESLVRLSTTRSQQRLGLGDPTMLAPWLIGPSLEHEALVGALRAGEPEAAADEARAHVMRAVSRIAAERAVTGASA